MRAARRAAGPGPTAGRPASQLDQERRQVLAGRLGAAAERARLLGAGEAVEPAPRQSMTEPRWNGAELRKRGWSDAPEPILGEPDDINRSRTSGKRRRRSSMPSTELSHRKRSGLVTYEESGRSPQPPARHPAHRKRFGRRSPDRAVLPVLSRLCAHASASRRCRIASRPIGTSEAQHQTAPGRSARLCARLHSSCRSGDHPSGFPDIAPFNLAPPRVNHALQSRRGRWGHRQSKSTILKAIKRGAISATRDTAGS